MAETRAVHAEPAAEPSPTRRMVAIVVTFALLGTLFDGAEINLVSYPMTYVADSLHTSTLHIVSINTYQGLATIAGGFLFGWLGDTIGRRKTYAMCVFAFGLGALIGCLAGSLAVFLLARLVAGLGMGGLFGLAFAMFTECWKTTRRGAMGGVIQAMFFVGQILTVGVIFACISGLGHDAGWRTGYAILGAASIAVSAAAIRWLPESPRWAAYRRTLPDDAPAAGRPGHLEQPERARARTAKAPVADLLRGTNARMFLTFAALSTGTFISSNAIGAYLSTFLLKTEHLSLARTTVIVLIGYVASIAAYTGTGVVSDLVRRNRAFFGASLVGLVGFTWMLILVTTKHDHVAKAFWSDQTFWALLLCAAGFGGFGVLGVWMSEIFPTPIRSTGANGSYYIGRGLGAGLFPLAALALTGTVAMSIGVGVIGPAVCVLISYTANDRTGRTIGALE